jgi:hypothetical protein
MQQPTIIRQPVPGGVRVSTIDESGHELDRGEIRSDRAVPGAWVLLDRNGRRLGTVTGDQTAAVELLIAATNT